jgi:hypothetical protein
MYSNLIIPWHFLLSLHFQVLIIFHTLIACDTCGIVMHYVKYKYIFWTWWIIYCVIISSLYLQHILCQPSSYVAPCSRLLLVLANRFTCFIICFACVCSDQYHLCRMLAGYTESFNLLLTLSQIQFCYIAIIPKNSLPHFWRGYHLPISILSLSCTLTTRYELTVLGGLFLYPLFYGCSLMHTKWDVSNVCHHT